MSATISVLDLNVRHLTHDRLIGGYEVGTEEMARKIVAKAQELTGKVLPGQAWSSALATLSAGNSDVSLPTTNQYAQIEEVKETVNGVPVPRVSEAVVEALRSGTATPQGNPQCYYVLESTTNAVTLRFWPWADVNYPLDVLLSNVPAASYVPGAVIPYDELALRAIERSVASECVAVMTPEQRAKLLVSSDVLAIWERDAASLLAGSRARKATQQRAGFITPQVR